MPLYAYLLILMDLSKKYDSKESELKWQKLWEKEGTYSFDTKSEKPLFSIDTPPPTMSGAMHIGHVFSYSQMDFIARFKRMQGCNVFYPFGTDDNGLPTDKMVEKLKKVKSSRMQRKEYVKLVLSTLDELRPKFVSGWKNIGISCDFNLYYSTINPHCQRISQKSFMELYNIERVYRKEMPFMWCPSCETAVAQVELEDKEIESSFNDIVFKVDGKEILIATTRPEMLPACVAVFVNPTDKRYKDIVGKEAEVPIFKQKVPVLADERADPEKGTGAVMCCTFGDQTDLEWFKAHNLPLKVAITKNGKMSEIAGKYAGTRVKEARKEIIKDLEGSGLLKASKKIIHAVNVHERCDTEMEILNTKQWFIKILDIKDELLSAGKKINWLPSHMRSRYDNWANGLQWDWSISRQRYFGVPFPIWYCKKCGEVMLADEKDLPVDPTTDSPKKPCKCGSTDFEPERDVQDTWATSSLTPRLAIELVDDKTMRKKLYPMTLRPQAHDIITFWLFNTVVKGLLHTKEVPWKNAMISGWALDPHGKKMSKSKGNVVDPAKVIEKFSADALRFWAAGSRLGDDLPYKEKDVHTGQKTVTKLWNASKFVISNLEGYTCEKPKKIEEIDAWVLHKLNNTIIESSKHFEDYEYSHARAKTEKFFWSVFCDNYLEIIKDRLYNADNYSGEEVASAKYALYNCLLGILKMFAPLMPHITEETYQLFFAKKESKKSIHNSEWPKENKEWENKKALESGDAAISVISAIRIYKTKKQLSPNAPLKEVIISEKLEKTLAPVASAIQCAMKVENVSFAEVKEVTEEFEFGGKTYEIKVQ